MSATKLLVISTFLFIMNAAQVKADEGGIQFEKTTWEQVKQKAKAENKLIFVDAFTTWCGPCKWMSANVFTDESVGAFYNKNFINFKYDMEKGEGVAFAREYQVRAYPTLLFIDAEGQLVHQVVGAQDVDKFIAFGKQALNPEKQISTLTKKFNGGERSPAFMRQYLEALAAANQKTDQVAAEYLSSIKKEQWSDGDNWEIISQYVTNSSSEVYQYVAANQDDFAELDTDAQVSNYLRSGLLNDARLLISSQDETQLKAFKINCKNILKGEEGDATIALVEMYFYQGNPEKSYSYAVTYLDNYCNNHNELNSMAWGVFERENDEVKLNKALEWVNKSIELDENFYNLDTKANLLHKLGNSETALPYAQRAVELGKAVGEDTAETERLVNQIKASLKD